VEMEMEMEMGRLSIIGLFATCIEFRVIFKADCRD
jgi:hypothetical protein